MAINEKDVLMQKGTDILYPISKGKNILLDDGRDVEEIVSSIFYWDGQSSTTNPDNKQLWQTIVNNAKIQTVLVVLAKSTETSGYSSVFILHPKLLNGSDTTLYSLPIDLTQAIYSNGTLNSVSKMSINISMTNYNISSIGTATRVVTSSNTDRFLPINRNITSYTPTHDYHPATKKYVDDSLPTIFVWNGIRSSSDPTSLDLWKKAFSLATSKPVVIMVSNSSQSNWGFIPIPQGSSPKASMYGSVTNWSVSSGAVTSSFLYRLYVPLTIVDTEITAVGNVSYSQATIANYLPTGTTNSTSQVYEPTKDWNPTNKRYVDTLVDNRINSLLPPSKVLKCENTSSYTEVESSNISFKVCNIVQDKMLAIKFLDSYNPRRDMHRVFCIR